MNVYRLWLDDGTYCFVRASLSDTAIAWAERQGKHVNAWEVSNGEGRTAAMPVFDGWRQ